MIESRAALVPLSTQEIIWTYRLNRSNLNKQQKGLGVVRNDELFLFYLGGMEAVYFKMESDSGDRYTERIALF